MKRLLTLCFMLLILAAAAVSALGDIARPRPEPTKSPEPKEVVRTSIEIVPDTKTAGSARLQLSESTVRELRNALNGGTTSQSFTQRMIHSPTNTLMAGVLLFLSISFAGIWLIRRSGSTFRRGQKVAASALIGIATLGAAAILTQANAGPPPAYLWRNLSKNLNAGKSTHGSLVVEIVPDSAGTKLIVPTRSSQNNDD